MARAPKPVRLSTTEAKYLLDVLNDADPRGRSVRVKLEAALDSPPEKPLHVTVTEAHRAMEDVLGFGTVALPPHPDGVWFAKITRRLRDYALTADDFRAAASKIRVRGWRPPFSFERTVYQMDRLYADDADVLERDRSLPDMVDL